MAVFQLADRIKETSTIVGTGTATLLGASTGFRSFSTFSDGDTVYYVIEAVDANGVPTGQWETGVGTVGGVGTTLARTTPKQGSSGVATLVNFAAGTKNVFVDEIASASMQANSSNTQVLFNNAGVIGGSDKLVVSPSTGAFVANQYPASNYYFWGGTPITLSSVGPYFAWSFATRIQSGLLVVVESADAAAAINFPTSFTGSHTHTDATAVGGNIYGGIWTTNQNAGMVDNQYTKSSITTSLVGATSTNVYELFLGNSLAGTHTNVYGLYVTDFGGVGTNTYYAWFDSRGVYRVREDAVADGAGNPQAIPSLYNPRFAKYTPGAADYERSVEQWVANVLQIGAEAGGTGVLRGTKILGATLAAPGTTITEAVGASGLTITGATQTASFPVINATQTWNNAGVDFIGTDYSYTSTASGANSKVARWRVGGTDIAHITKTGAVNSAIYFSILGQNSGLWSSAVLTMDSATKLGWAPAAGQGWNTSDAFFTKGGAATIQLGADVNGAAVSQTIQACNGITGTDRTGGNFTLASGKGTGAGAVSSIFLQTPTVLGSGTTAQSLTTRVTIDSSGLKATGYLSSDGTAGATGGPWTSVTFKNGLAVSGS